MIDIGNEIEQKLVLESRKKKLIFNDDSLTFKQLRDIFSDIFGTKIVKVTRKVPMSSVYFTNKDGKYYIASANRPKKLLAVKDSAKLVECDNEQYASKTFDSILKKFDAIDPKDANRAFANGKNFAKFNIMIPPKNFEDRYNGEDYAVFDGIWSFDDKGNCIGKDQKTTDELSDTFCCSCKDSVDSSIANAAMSRFCPCEQTLKNIMKCLSKMAIELGWNCSIKDYIQDRYSKFIMNKALQHDIDISKNGSFTRELCDRLSKTAKLIPTKSDLVTFAKREGINCNSQQYKDFIDDIEQQATSLNDDIVQPIQKIIFYGICNALNTILGFLAFDPDIDARKLAENLSKKIEYAADSVEESEINDSKIKNLKECAIQVANSLNAFPREVMSMINGRPFVMMQDFSKLDKLFNIMERN